MPLAARIRACTPFEGPTQCEEVPPRTPARFASPASGAESSAPSAAQELQRPVTELRVRTSTVPLSTVFGSFQVTPIALNDLVERAGSTLSVLLPPSTASEDTEVW